VTNRSRLSAGVIVLCALVLCPCSAGASVDPYGTAEALYTAGQYDAAVQAARQIGSAEAHALGARALLAKTESQVPFDQRLPVLKEAEAEADAAIAANDKVIEGHLQKLMAYCYITRMPGFRDGDIAASRVSRTMLDRALALEPNNPWALAALGGWNLEIIRRAPLGLGGILFGANRTKGMAAFEKALVLAPNNVVIRYEFGLALLSLDDRKAAESALTAAIVLQTDDAYSRFLQARGQRLLALVAAQDHRTLDKVLAAYRGERKDVSTNPAPKL